jgi:hypothetical protein
MGRPTGRLRAELGDAHEPRVAGQHGLGPAEAALVPRCGRGEPRSNDTLRRRLPGYETAAPDTIWRRFLSTPGDITLGPDEVVVSLRSRTYSPVLRSADHPLVQVPW